MSLIVYEKSGLSLKVDPASVIGKASRSTGLALALSSATA
jgi:hypothetical protein